MGIRSPRIRILDHVRSMAHAIHPPVCHVCDRPIGQHADQLCIECWGELGAAVGDDRCRTCGDARGPHLLIDGRCAACRTNKHGHLSFDGFVCVGPYGGALRALLLQFKRSFVLDGLLGHLLGCRIAASGFAATVDYWAPVPSHWLRRIRRGFEPPLLLARSALAEIGRRPDRMLSVRRLVPEFHRYGLSASARSRAVSGAFALRAGASCRGASVCLIDDVMTTGATLAELARILRKNGAKAVFAAVVARTQPDAAPDHEGGGPGD